MPKIPKRLIKVRGVHMTIPEAMEQFGISRTTVYRYIDAGRLDDLGQGNRHPHSGHATEITIRGVRYPSRRAAAERLNVDPSAITKAEQRGTLDSVGLLL